jgi:hypothetical protein
MRGYDRNLRDLVSYAIADRFKSICVEQWRMEITSIVRSMWCNEEARNFQRMVKSIYAKLALFESITEGAPMIELALWKTKIVNSQSEQMYDTDEALFQIQCRLSCGLDTVIANVLLYLLPGPDEVSDESSIASEADY